MISIIEIYNSIDRKIKSVIKDTDFKDVEIVAEDLSAPIIRPSVKITLDNSISGKLNANLSEKTLTFRVYFFAKNKDRPKIENLKMQDLIETALLEELEINQTNIFPILEVESDVSDGVLIVNFDVYIRDVIYVPDDSEILEDINIKI